MTAYWQRLVAGAFDRSRQDQPPDRATVRVAALELQARGLTPHDIAAALRLSEAAIRALLGEAT